MLSLGGCVGWLETTVDKQELGWRKSRARRGGGNLRGMCIYWPLGILRSRKFSEDCEVRDEISTVKWHSSCCPQHSHLLSSYFPAISSRATSPSVSFRSHFLVPPPKLWVLPTLGVQQHPIRALPSALTPHPSTPLHAQLQPDCQP